MATQKEKYNTIRVRRIVLKNYKELHAISDNVGEGFSTFMRKSLTKVADSFPAEYKKEPEMNQEIKEYFTIFGVSKKTERELLYICENIGCDLSDLLKIELKKLAESYPARMKKPPLDY